jgi:hypothetical protein
MKLTTSGVKMENAASTKLIGKTYIDSKMLLPYDALMSKEYPRNWKADQTTV